MLVTGATGFLASHVVHTLLLSGYRVRGTVRACEKGECDLLLDEICGRRHDDAGEMRGRFEEVVCDLLRDEGWDDACAGCKFICHVASPVLLRRDVPDESAMFRPAIGGTRRLMSAAARNGVRRVIFTSSVGAAVASPGRRKYTCDEGDFTDPWDEGHIPYVRSKAFAELSAWLYAGVRPIPRADIAAVLCPRDSKIEESGAFALEESTTAWIRDEIAAIENEKCGDLDLVVVNPAYIIGPILLDRHAGRPGSSSTEIVRIVMTDARMQIAQPGISLPVVDVRDVAILQVPQRSDNLVLLRSSVSFPS